MARNWIPPGNACGGTMIFRMHSRRTILDMSAIQR
jgi:hypothetical protein